MNKKLGGYEKTWILPHDAQNINILTMRTEAIVLTNGVDHPAPESIQCIRLKGVLGTSAKELHHILFKGFHHTL